MILFVWWGTNKKFLSGSSLKLHAGTVREQNIIWPKPQCRKWSLSIV